MANSVDPDQTAPIGAVCSGSTLFASILNSSVMQGNYLQQTTSADDIFRCIFFLGALRVNMQYLSEPFRIQYSCINQYSRPIHCFYFSLASQANYLSNLGSQIVFGLISKLEGVIQK